MLNSVIENVVAQYIAAILVAVTLAVVAAARSRLARKARALTPPQAGSEPSCGPSGPEAHPVRQTRRARRPIRSSHGRREESSS